MIDYEQKNVRRWSRFLIAVNALIVIFLISSLLLSIGSAWNFEKTLRALSFIYVIIWFLLFLVDIDAYEKFLSGPGQAGSTVVLVILLIWAWPISSAAKYGEQVYDNQNVLICEGIKTLSHPNVRNNPDAYENCLKREKEKAGKAE